MVVRCSHGITARIPIIDHWKVVINFVEKSDNIINKFKSRSDRIVCKIVFPELLFGNGFIFH